MREKLEKKIEIMYELKTCSMTGKAVMIHDSKEPLKLCLNREEFRLTCKKKYSQIYREIKAKSLVWETAS